MEELRELLVLEEDKCLASTVLLEDYGVMNVCARVIDLLFRHGGDLVDICINYFGFSLLDTATLLKQDEIMMEISLGNALISKHRELASQLLNDEKFVECYLVEELIKRSEAVNEIKEKIKNFDFPSKRARVYYEKKDYRMSAFYQLYIATSEFNETDSRRKLFKRRFRVSYQWFLDFLENAETECYFPGWGETDENGMLRTDALGNRSKPLSLLLLASLRFLGRNVTFDDMAESTLISETTLRTFFVDAFIPGMMSKFVPQHLPDFTMTELTEALESYERVGFPGCIGSLDVTHVRLENCYKNLGERLIRAKMV